MKKILRIARIELSILFYSPIAWFILIIVTIQCGIQYSEIMDRLILTQERNGSWIGFNPLLTSETFLGLHYVGLGFFSYIVGKLFLYLPLITMGLISRETSSGTIKLLYSSPLKIRDIVFGKFTAIVIFSLLLVLILAGFGVTAMATIQSADYGQILSGLLGVLMLLCAYSAIGLFMSCITTHQIVAALGTLVVFALLEYIGAVWQDVDFVRELTYYLSISGRTRNMLAGLISTKDFMYFLSITGLFLGFSYFKLRSTRESKPAVIRTSRYIVAVAAVVVLVYVSSLPGFVGYIDATQTKRNTLSPNAQTIVEKMKDGPIEVTSYINLLGEHFYHGTPQNRMIDIDRWERYLRFKPDIKMNYVYYYDTSFVRSSPFKIEPNKTIKELAEKYSRMYKVSLNRFKTPEEIRKIINLREEKYRYVMRIQYNNRSTFLRLYNDQAVFPSEAETMAALKRLTEDRFPTIGFLEEELERNPANSEGGKDYGFLTSEITFRFALKNQGFDVERIPSGKAVPSNISALVIADPRANFSLEALAHIQNYIQSGGNLLIAGEPGKQHVLNPILEPLGIQLKDGLLVQPNKNLAPDLTLADFTEITAGFSRSMAYSAKDSDKVVMNGAAGLTYKKGTFEIQPLLISNAKSSWIKKGELTEDTVSMRKVTINNNANLNSAIKQGQNSSLTFIPADGDEKGSFPTALALTRKINQKEQRIVVTGDADFLSNAEIVSPRYFENYKVSNFGFATALFGWLSQGEYPVDTERPRNKDTRINLTDKQLSMLNLFWIYLLPGGLLIFATALIIRRRNK
ncbi:MAG: Gldg family protein [Bacteroidota bacterium]